MPKKSKNTSSKKNEKPVIDRPYLKSYCNLIPDRLDPRDRSFMASQSTTTQQIPKKKDYSAETKPVGDQGATGSCVGWASSYGLRRWLHYNTEGIKKKFSVRFVWTASKELDQWVPNALFELAGTSIRDAFKVMRKYGACSDGLWPFSSALPSANKEAKIKSDAMKYRINNYHSLTSNQERRTHLAKSGPFVIGVPVHTNWDQIDSSGIVPNPGGQQTGGHAVLVVGYDDDTEFFKFQNSWGTAWGNHGFGYFTYSYVENHSWNSWGADRL